MSSNMTLEEHKREHRRLQELTHRNLMRLIDSELSLALTMWDLAATEAELGDVSNAEILLKKVEEALDTVRQHMTDNRVSGEEKTGIGARLQELTKGVDEAKKNLSEGSSRVRGKTA